MPVPARLLPFWTQFAQVTNAADDSRFHEAFCFGDSEVLANELAERVVRGVKRATAGSMWSYEAEGKPLPQAGDLSIVTTWAGEPLCVIRTESVAVMAFRDVPAEFAAREGEGDGSLAFWQQAHREYFTRECLRAGREFGEDMLVACESFSLVYPGAPGAA